jgi:hypothetical protein
MIDIKQEELDKRFVRGVLAAESAIFDLKFLTNEQINVAAEAFHRVIVAEIGEARLQAIQGENAREPKA